MTKIYPKFCEGNTLSEQHIRMIYHSNGFELQLKPGAVQRYTRVVEEIFSQLDEEQVEEITIHLPLDDINIEAMESSLISKGISCSHRIHINLLFHITAQPAVAKGRLVKKVQALLNEIGESYISLLAENSVILEKGTFSGLLLARELNDPRFGLCLDTTHYRCIAKLYGKEPSKYLQGFLCDDGKKYVRQIHFASFKGDGFKERSTHGRVHSSLAELGYEYQLLVEANLENATIVLEINEDDQ